MKSSPSPALFKGIALFTPAGDVIYCIDPSKRDRWHLNLCAAFQEILRLPEPPHFLVPCYTATVDRWRDPQTQKIQTVAEAAPAVLRYQTLLNAIFRLGNQVWQTAPVQSELCDPMVLHTYEAQFPELWECHDLVVSYEQVSTFSSRSPQPPAAQPERSLDLPKGYVLRLYVSGHNIATERTLTHLHQLLEQTLRHPYTLKVIDVLQHPEEAERDQVAATPTLVRAQPEPRRRIVGNVENVDQLVALLEVWEEMM